MKLAAAMLLSIAALSCAGSSGAELVPLPYAQGRVYAYQAARPFAKLMDSRLFVERCASIDEYRLKCPARLRGQNNCTFYMLVHRSKWTAFVRGRSLRCGPALP